MGDVDVNTGEIDDDVLFGGFGLVGNIVVGVIGAFIGGYLFSALGIAAGGLIGSLVTATVGALVLLWVVGLLKKG